VKLVSDVIVATNTARGDGQCVRQVIREARRLNTVAAGFGPVVESRYPNQYEVPMAGHSKWANIQHRKKAQDAKRGKLFTKLIREIVVAARQGGGDPAGNSRLRLAIDKGLSGNLPKDTIERAVKKASGEAGDAQIEEIRYEGYGPGGVAVMVECMTDNRNRTVSEVRHAFTKFGGNLGTDGSVAYLFSKVGQLSFPAGADEDVLMEVALEAGADDVVSNDDGSIDILTAPENFPEVRDAVAEGGHVAEAAEVTMRPATSVSLDVDEARTMFKLLDVLDDLDDVQQVYSNADIAESVLAELD
jgi:YebC/PmpR family DNA-binding regulatory protein